MNALLGMKLLREPLLHFIAMGAVIFGLYGLTRGETESTARNQIVVAAGDIERLAGLWQKRWQRPPTTEELKGLIDQYVQEEILYREALALGLDRDDSVVRRRLAQKFAFLSEDIAASRDPTADELADFFEIHRDYYKVQPRVSFTQVYFSPDRRGSTARHDAEFALAGLRADPHGIDLDRLGDGTLLNLRYHQQTPQQIASIFGPALADAVAAQEPGAWFGPIASGFGLHLLRVDERIPARLPALAEIEGRLRADWFYEQRQQANKDMLQLLLARYTVVIADEALQESVVALSNAK